MVLGPGQILLPCSSDLEAASGLEDLVELRTGHISRRGQTTAYHLTKRSSAKHFYQNIIHSYSAKICYPDRDDFSLLIKALILFGGLSWHRVLAPEEMLFEIDQTRNIRHVLPGTRPET
jgi:hypothetical protein